MSVLLALTAAAVCVGVGLLATRLPGGGPGVGAPVEEPVALGAGVGMLGVGLVGAAVLGGPVSHPLPALLGFVLVAVGLEVGAGGVAAVDRLCAALLVSGACVLPFLRYGASTYDELRGMTSVLGSPLVTGPGLRLLQTVIGAVIACGAAAWLVAGVPRRVPAAVVAARPDVLVPGAAALLIAGSYSAGLAPSGGRTLVVVRGLFGLLLVVAIAVGVTLAGRVIRRLPEPRFAGGVAAVLLVGCAGGLAI